MRHPLGVLDGLWSKALVLSGLLGGCDNMSIAQKGALGGAALGTGIGLAAGGSFGVVDGRRPDRRCSRLSRRPGA